MTKLHGLPTGVKFINPMVQRIAHNSTTANNFRVFHLFGQAKFANGGSILRKLEPIFATVPAALKNEARLSQN